MRSVWFMDSTLPGYPPLRGNRRCDVLVIGGGLAGLWIARRLHDEGLRVILAEADTLCSGTSGNTTAKITAQHGLVFDRLIRRVGARSAGIYLRANLRALSEYRKMAESADIEFREAPSYVYATDDRAALEKEMAALAQLGYPAVFTSQTELPFPVAGAVSFPGQAECNPLRVAAALLPGLEIYEHTRIRSLRGNLAMTDGGVISSDRMVVTTHFPYLNRHGFYFLKMYQSRSYVIALRGAALPDGSYIGADSAPFSFRRYDDLLLLGGGGHRTGKPGGGFSALAEAAKRWYPGAEEVCRFATQDCITPDGIPYVGQYSRRTPGLYVATGFNKWGMTGTLAAADLLTDLINGRKNEAEEVYSPSRMIPLPKLFKNLGSALSGWLTPGPRCPHLGCRLSWNPEEHSWDCSCHGSRFAKDGDLLDNPATGPLSKPPNAPPADSSS